MNDALLNPSSMFCAPRRPSLLAGHKGGPSFRGSQADPNGRLCDTEPVGGRGVLTCVCAALSGLGVDTNMPSSSKQTGELYANWDLCGEAPKACVRTLNYFLDLVFSDTPRTQDASPNRSTTSCMNSILDPSFRTYTPKPDVVVNVFGLYSSINQRGANRLADAALCWMW